MFKVKIIMCQDIWHGFCFLWMTKKSRAPRMCMCVWFNILFFDRMGVFLEDEEISISLNCTGLNSMNLESFISE